MQSFRTDKLHLQVQEHLLTLVDSGEYGPGARLPSEVDLAAQLGVSRPTLREALLHMEQKGVVVRRHGVGTFVSAHTPVLESGLEVLESLERQARRLGLNTRVVHLDVVERPPAPCELDALSLPQNGTTDVLNVDRVIAVEGEPVAHLRDVVPLTRLRGRELGDDFSGSVLDVLLQRGTPPPATSRTEIMAEGAGAQSAALLGIPRGTALLKLVGWLYADDDQVLDYSVSYFIPGHFRFHVMRRVGAG